MKFHLPSALLGAILIVSIGLFCSFQGTIHPVPLLTPAQIAVLDTLSVETLPDCVGGPGYKTLRVNAANLQVVNGLGSTDTINGLGNLIVGYKTVSSNCEGSHNLLIGPGHSYTSYGSIVAGYQNSSFAAYNIVFGSNNTADSYNSSILGGASNNTQSNDGSVIVGGLSNIAIGYESVILGGEDNTVNNSQSCIVGGQNNTSFGGHSVIGGGRGNTIGINASWGTVDGGNTRSVAGIDDWAAGSLFEDN